MPGTQAIEVRTLHALARQVLLDAGHPVRLLPDRLPLLRAARRRAIAEDPVVADGDAPPPEPPDPSALETIVSAWKVEGRPPPPAARSAVQAFQALMEARGLVDFDDLWSARWRRSKPIRSFEAAGSAAFRTSWWTSSRTSTRRSCGSSSSSRHQRTTFSLLVMMISRSSELAHIAPRSFRTRWPETALELRAVVVDIDRSTDELKRLVALS